MAEEADEYDDTGDDGTSSLSAPLFLPPPPPTSRRKPSGNTPSRSDVALILRPVFFGSDGRGEEGREAALRDWGEAERVMRRLMPLGERPLMEGERGMRWVVMNSAGWFDVDGAQAESSEGKSCCVAVRRARERESAGEVNREGPGGVPARGGRAGKGFGVLLQD